MLRKIADIGVFFKRHPFVRSLSLVFCSSFLLVLAFPQTEIWIFAWIGLVPLMMAIDGKKPWAAFTLGYLAGVMFFLGTVYWFIHVTLLGMILLVLYLALYFALFAFGYSYFAKETVMFRLWLLPSLWVALEYLKGHLLSGFGWVSLGQSQYRNLYMIQIADVTGMFGVSFLVVAVNVLINELLAKTKKPLPACAAVAALLFVSGAYGALRLHEANKEEQVKIAVVQANTPQEVKWDEWAWPAIMEKYLDLTGEVAREKPDLILWPETAFPGFVWESPQLFIRIKAFAAKLQTPILLGLVTQIEEDYFNSAVLVSGEGDIVDQHDKLHLVPFGEYIPFRNIFPFLEHIAPIGDFRSGGKYTLFPAATRHASPAAPHLFSVLICFEDTIPELSRRFALRGAEFFVNITNDAWFQDTKAPFIHMLASFFRSIENRRFLIRSTNTGVSCFIDPYGRIVRYLQNAGGRKTYIEGHATAYISPKNEMTFYTKYGDVFTYFCFGSILVGVLAKKFQGFPDFRG